MSKNTKRLKLDDDCIENIKQPQSIYPASAASSSDAEQSQAMHPASAASSSDAEQPQSIYPASAASSSDAEQPQAMHPASAARSSYAEQSQAMHPASTASSSVAEQSQAMHPASAASSSDAEQPQSIYPASAASSSDAEQPQAMHPAPAARSSDAEQSQAMHPASAANSSDAEQSQAMHPASAANSSDTEQSQAMHPASAANSSDAFPCLTNKTKTCRKMMPTVRLYAQKRKFQSDWLKQLKWLSYDATTRLAKCKICSDYPHLSDQSSKVVLGFCGPFKLDSFKKHEISVKHLRCTAAHEGELNQQVRPQQECMNKMDEKMFKTAFNCAYYIAKSNKPFSDLPELIGLLSKCDVETLHQYSNKPCMEFISHIASVVRSDLIRKIKKSPFVSLLLDSSSDKSEEEQLIVCVRYLKNTKLEEAFLSILPLEDATANEYLTALQNQLQTLNLTEIMSGKSLVGIGTDGAAIMVGEENGLVAKLTKLDGLEHVVGIHCNTHNLLFSVLSSIKNVKYMEEVDGVLQRLYSFYYFSPKRMRQLKKVSQALECELVKLHNLRSVRWVASKVEALTALVQDWKCIVFHLEELGNGKEDGAATARSLVKKLKCFRFRSTVHFLLDFLNIFKELSLIFQKKDLLLSLVDLHVNKALSSLERMIEQQGLMDADLISKTTLTEVFQETPLTNLERKAFGYDRKVLIENGIKYLKEKFTSTWSDITLATSVFDTCTWPSDEMLDVFGVNELKELALHFRKQMAIEERTGMFNGLIDEWCKFKVLGQGLNLELLLDKAISMNKQFPLLSKLLSIVAVLPVSSVACERGFQLMNMIKNKFTSSEEADSLNDLLMVNTNGPSLVDFDPTRSVDNWYSNTVGSRRTAL
ncbi:hypothetical protein FKM82_001240 [Ascaphus truei]